VVAEGLTPEVVSRLAPKLVRTRLIAPGRYSLEMGPDARPEPLVAELAAAGASLLSVTPLRTTLEDVFLARVGDAARAGGQS
jgi:hypothetical protein